MKFRLWFLSIAVIAASAAVAASSSRAADRPNFVVILADDLGYGDLSCYDGWIATPAIDRLAAMGIRLTDFHSSGAVCSPTRAGLMTGRYQQRCGITGVVYADPDRGWRERGLPLNEITLPEVLRGAGYHTAMFGKWHLGYAPRFNPIRQGFQQFKGYVSGNVDYFSHIDQAGFADWWSDDQLLDEPGYSTHLINRYAVDYLSNVDTEQPFFLYVAHEAPHSPYQGPGDSAVRTKESSTTPRAERVDIRRAYREMVTEMDSGIGTILDTLQRRQLDHNTIVLFCSDNGGTPNGSNAHLRGFKGQVYEGGHRVPAVVCWPGHLRAGETIDQTAMTIDVMPTLLDLAGVSAAADRPLDGISLKGLLESNRALPERRLFWEHGNSQAVRAGHWKLVRTDSGRARSAAQLYNLQDDPGETTDLAARHKDIVDQLVSALEQWKQSVDHDGQIAMQPQLQNQ